MSILKFENRTPRTLEDMCVYMRDPLKTDISGVFGIGLINPYNAETEMKFIQNFYRQDNLTYEYLQIIFCFDKGIEADIGTMREVCERIGQVLITDKRQVLGAIHYLSTDKIHCHYLINYVGIDGSLYQQKFSVLHYKKLVNSILIAYGFQPIKCKESVNDNKEGLAIAEPFHFFEDNAMDKKKTTGDNAISVEEFRRRNPNVELNALQVNYSNENVRRIEAFPTYSSVSMIDTAVTPYGYLQGGYGLNVLYPASSYYLLPPQFFPEARAQEKQIKDFIYAESSTTLFWLRRNKGKLERVPLTNFCLSIEKIYTLVATNAQEERITLSVQGKSNVMLDIPLDKLTALYQELTKSHPEYRLHNAAKSQANHLFQQYVSEVYEISLECLPHETVYKNAGWQLSSGGWHYFSGTDKNCRSDFHLATVDTAKFDLVDWVGGLLEVGDYQIMLPLLLHAHLGYTLKLFEDAGYNEQYILAMIGASGSKKTSLARVLFSLFGDALINFTSTDRAIELELMSRQDSTMILDDLSSGSDKFLAGKFEKILRQLGDSTGRKRSINSGAEQDAVNTRCAVVLTAETDIDALSKSSKLRTLAVYLNVNSLDSAKLKEFQDDEFNAKMTGGFSKLEQYMTCYVKFLETHYQQMVEVLRTAKLKVTEDFSFARQATIFNMLVGQAELVLLFWLYCNMFSTEKDFVKVYAHWLDVLKRVMEANEQRGKEAEPYVLFLQAVSQALRTGFIAASKDFVADKSIGYVEKTDVILFPDAAYDYVISYYSRLGKIFSEGKRTLWDKFYSLNLIEVYEQQNHKPKLFKKIKLNGVPTDCLWLKWRVVEQLLNQVNNSLGGNTNGN